MFFPSGAPFGNCPQADRMDVEAVQKSGTRYYVRKSEDSSSPWLVIFHGNAGCACDRMYFFQLFESVEATVAVFEYPGYGGDSIKPGETVILREAEKLVRHILEEMPENTQLFLAGESLGTGIATRLATEMPVAGLILISPYTSIVDVASAHYFWLPVRLLLKNRFPADRWAKGVDAPVIAFHGKNDTIIPLRFAQRQIKNFPGNAVLFELDNTGHNDIVVSGESFIKAEVKRLMDASRP